MNTEGRKEWRKKRIDDMHSGSGITDLTMKQGVDVINSVIEDLADSIDRSSQSSDRLTRIVAIATVFLVLIGIADLFVRFFECH
ncbi:MAG: hypothetical protein PHI97_35400 [Desulfobulbus sp.]|nr:hypothetical protein [Desulfobulbus sp.]